MRGGARICIAELQIRTERAASYIVARNILPLDILEAVAAYIRSAIVTGCYITGNDQRRVPRLI